MVVVVLGCTAFLARRVALERAFRLPVHQMGSGLYFRGDRGWHFCIRHRGEPVPPKTVLIL